MEKYFQKFFSKRSQFFPLRFFDKRLHEQNSSTRPTSNFAFENLLNNDWKRLQDKKKLTSAMNGK
jgi:hypothetical protein